MSAHVRDDRLPPFAWLDLSALDCIREQAPSSQVASVRNVYAALAESASRALDGRQTNFKTTRAALAHLAGVSVKTVDRCCAILVELGILVVESRADEDGWTLPSIYRLLRRDAPRMAYGGDTESPPRDGGGNTESPPITRTRDEGKNTEDRSTTDIAHEPSVKFKGKRVPDDVSSAALAALARWNEQTGQTLKPFTGQGKPSEGLRVIVGAMLDYPEAVTLWPQMIDSALRSPWWSDDAPGPGVVFGGKVRERMIQQAQRPAIAATAAVGGNVHRFASKFERAQSGLAELHAQLVAEGR